MSNKIQINCNNINRIYSDFLKRNWKDLDACLKKAQNLTKELEEENSLDPLDQLFYKIKLEELRSLRIYEKIYRDSIKYYSSELSSSTC